MTVYITHGLYTGFNGGIPEIDFAQLSRYARRATNLIVALFMVLLVGSCIASQANGITYDADRSVQELRTALFPARANVQDAHYQPAATDISRARHFVETTPKAILSMTRDEVGYLFGKPSFRRHDADAEVWQYKTAGCVIDFYFYGEKQVSYIDARHKDQTPASASEQSSCLRQI